MIVTTIFADYFSELLVDRKCIKEMFFKSISLCSTVHFLCVAYPHSMAPSISF